MWWKPFGTGVAPTHKGRMSRKYIIRCFQQRWSWKNCSSELQNDSMAKVWETNQEGITRMGQHTGKKCNDKNTMTKMHVHEDIGAKRTAAILTCAGWVLDRRQVGEKPFCTYKALSCVKLLEIKLVGYVYFWIKLARLFNPLILGRSDPAETQSLLWRMSGWRYSTVRLSTYCSN